MSKLQALVLAVIGSLAVPALAAAQVADYREIQFPELERFEIPRPETFQLDNGLTVFLLEDHELPLVQVVARVRTGGVWEPAEKIGLASLFGSVQRTGGTVEMTGDEMDNFLEARAASVETSAGRTVGFASMDCLADDLDEVLPVFRDVLRRPVFEADKLEIAKAQARTGIARRNDNVQAITAREFSRLVYGLDSPLSRLQEYATVAAVTRDDLLAWHQRFYHPNNILLGVVGDFDPVTIRSTLESAFGDWPRGPDAPMPELPYREEPTAGVYFIEKEDVTQANVRAGHLGITYEDPDFFAIQVMNEILSGGFSGRILRNIRSEKGLAYSAGGGVGAAFAFPGIAGFGLQTKSETMGEAVDALFEELEGMIVNPATDAELGRAKDTILNSFIFNYASKRQILGQQMLYAYYGMPADFLETYRSRIEDVTAADVARVASEHLHPDRATLLVVGRSADFDRPVSTLGEVTTLDITIPPPPAEPAVIAPADLSDAAKARARAAFERMVAAVGGADPAGVDSVKTQTRVNVSMGGQAMTLTQTSTVAFPDRVATALETPMGVQEIIINGDRGILRAAGQTQVIPGERVRERLADLVRDLFGLARRGAIAGPDEIELTLVGEESIEDGAVDVVRVAIEGVATRLWIDAEGRVAKQAFESSHPMTGAPGRFEVSYSNYREVEGRWFPFARSTTIDGEAFAETMVESVQFDPPVDPERFALPDDS